MCRNEEVRPLPGLLGDGAVVELQLEVLGYDGDQEWYRIVFNHVKGRVLICHPFYCLGPNKGPRQTWLLTPVTCV